MRSISIKFQSDVSPEKRKAVLEKINGWKSIKEAGQLMPGSQSTSVQRMAYAYLDDDSEIEDVSKELEAIPEIETAPAAPERHLISGADMTETKIRRKTNI